ncbi:hypothetical protein P171DRAFT_427346 [Karstenula rhodostoma CBS 690.94]|uniref:Ankyrin n=1 Tax=Karstenula rhodostoma CBS 690.94 TaxID=1392251 RepID=A0A9P4UGI3_9PLEO|nr:hypothetical protein P171DRAFT_427346 [Karstenula rhodostoma CBS 690.94]
MSQESQHPPASANNEDHTQEPLPRSPLITEPISNHSVSTMLSAVRTAIENGADVNALDTEPNRAYNEGRPLDACLTAHHMPSGKSIIENLPVIELLLEHGADPRLWSESTTILGMPIVQAITSAKDERITGEAKAFWKRLLKLFEEAIERLDAKKRETAGAEERGEDGE